MALKGIRAIPLIWERLENTHKDLPQWEGIAPLGIGVRVIDEGHRVITAGTWAEDHGQVTIEEAKKAAEARHQNRVLSLIETDAQ